MYVYISSSLGKNMTKDEKRRETVLLYILIFTNKSVYFSPSDFGVWLFGILKLTDCRQFIQSLLTSSACVNHHCWGTWQFTHRKVTTLLWKTVFSMGLFVAILVACSPLTQNYSVWLHFPCKGTFRWRMCYMHWISAPEPSVPTGNMLICHCISVGEVATWKHPGSPIRFP